MSQRAQAGKTTSRGRWLGLASLSLGVAMIIVDATRYRQRSKSKRILGVVFSLLLPGGRVHADLPERGAIPEDVSAGI